MWDGVLSLSIPTAHTASAFRAGRRNFSKIGVLLKLRVLDG
jgi:hypothetical protein